MKRLPIVAMLLGPLACGPTMSAGESSSADSTSTSTGTSEDDDGTESDEGETDEGETDEGETDEGETGSDSSECYGDGNWHGFYAGNPGKLEPVSIDDEYWDWSTVHALTCVVATVDSSTHTWWITLACEDDDLSLDLDWSVPLAFELIDASWLGKSLSVVAQGGHPPVGVSRLQGWAVVRDEQGELVWISAEPWLPEPKWTEPISIEVLDLGHDCVVSDDECLPIYANVVLFDSPFDGVLRSYRGSGHQTEHFSYVGDSTTRESNWTPSEPECGIPADYHVGRWDWVRVVRRP